VFPKRFPAKPVPDLIWMPVSRDENASTKKRSIGSIQSERRLPMNLIQPGKQMLNIGISGVMLRSEPE
jgi:hypothetical protein